MAYMEHLGVICPHVLLVLFHRPLDVLLVACEAMAASLRESMMMVKSMAFLPRRAMNFRSTTSSASRAKLDEVG